MQAVIRPVNDLDPKGRERFKGCTLQGAAPCKGLHPARGGNRSELADPCAPRAHLEVAPLKQGMEFLAVIVDARATLTHPVGDLPAFGGRVPNSPVLLGGKRRFVFQGGRADLPGRTDRLSWKGASHPPGAG
jgi:hypothetical protein